MACRRSALHHLQPHHACYAVDEPAVSCCFPAKLRVLCCYGVARRHQQMLMYGAAGNGGSLDKCRRRWDLADADFLKYKFMNTWDRAMQHLDKAFGFVCSPHEYVSRKVSKLPWL